MDQGDGGATPAPVVSKRTPRWRRRAARWTKLIAAPYALLCGGVFLFQERLIYFPQRGYHATPAEVGLQFETVSLRAADGVKIAAWYVPSQRSRATVLFCHGNAGNNSDRLGTIRELNRLGLSVLIFDYRGYGDSGGAPSEAGTYADAQAAWEYLLATKQLPPDRIILMGESIGGAVAIELAYRHTPGALVVESTFTSLPDVAAGVYPWLPVRWLCRHRYASIDKVGQVTCPKLFYHGREDELVPLAMARRLFDAACPPKQFIETPGGHNNSGFLYSEEYVETLGRFLDEVLGAASTGG